MKVTTLYTCEKCWADYATPEEALACEKRHLEPCGVQGEDWDGMGPISYPATVLVQFPDAVQARYAFQETVRQREAVRAVIFKRDPDAWPSQEK